MESADGFPDQFVCKYNRKRNVVSQLICPLALTTFFSFFPSSFMHYVMFAGALVTAMLKKRKM